MCKKLYIKTWGCQINEYDSNKIVNYLKKDNKYKLTPFINKANLIILNTCSVREKAHEKLFHVLGRIRKIKKLNYDLIVCVVGCVAVQEKKKIFYRSKGVVDIILGSKSLKKISKLVNIFKKNKKKIIDVNLNKIERNVNSFINFSNSIKLSSYVPIMEGCNKFCTYCIVPFTKGREISRYPLDIKSEIMQLSINGVKEVHLLGQNVNAYLSYFPNGKICNFVQLLQFISDIKSISRIRFTTSHPSNFTDDIVACYKSNFKIVNFLHLPVQSGSNKILKKMGRNYTIEYYLELINKILKVRPLMRFSSDFIVGFPGETEKDFLLTLDLISKVKFDFSYSFIYSPRPGTKSYYMVDTISNLEKKKRLYEIQNLIYQNTLYWSKKMLNNIEIVLVEGISKKRNNFYVGRTDNNRIVNFLSNKNCLGDLINIKINKVYKNCLYGEVIH